MKDVQQLSRNLSLATQNSKKINNMGCWVDRR